MTTRTFGSLANHESFDFNPGDTIKFGLTYQASKLVLKEDGGNLLCTYGAKTVTLGTFGLADITPTSFVFADGSLVKAGTAGADTLQGQGFDDLMFGLAGDDKVQGGDGNDMLDGGAGADTMNGGLGSDSFVIDSMADKVTELADSLAGVGDVDTVTELVNNDTLDASVEKMILGTGIVKGTGNTSDNTLAGNASDNKLFGLGGADTLVGKTGNDVLDGGNGSDSMNGGAGDDLYVLSSLGDVIVELAEDVGGGIDTVRLGADIGDYSLDVEGLLENLDASMVLGPPRSYAGNDDNNVITGSVGSDTIYGHDGNDTIDGGDGGDALFGEVLDDTLTGGLGNDTLDGGLGADSLSGGTGDDSLLGGASGLDGDDLLDGGGGADAMDGGYGDDTYVVNLMGDAVTEGVSAGNDTVRIVGSAVPSYSVYGGNVENIDASLAGAGLTLTGSNGANIILGSASADVIVGYGGSDSLVGGGGNDSILAQSVNDLGGVADTIDGGTGRDTMNGGYGDDVYVVNVATDQIDELIATMGNDTVLIVGNSITSYDLTTTSAGSLENVDASDAGFAGGLTLTGNTAANIITGSAGNDAIDATQGGGDDLSGGDGNDSITSGAAAMHFDDTLNGGAGNDTLAGGYGSDTYVIDSFSDSIVTGVTQETEQDGWDTDTVQIVGSTIHTYTLASQLENLDASGSSYGGAIMHLAGNAFNNILTGSGVNDSIVGNGGNDDLHGGNGDDALYAGSGNDLLDGGAGFDYLQGGTGDDTYVVDQNGELTSISTNEDSVHGGGHDTLRIAASNTFNGAITLLANLEDLDASESGSSNVLYGNASNNHVIGSSFGESIFGDTGIDSIEGGDGNDSLYDDFAYGGGFGISGGDGFDIVKTADGQDVDFRPIADSIGGVEAIWMLNDTNGNLITLESSDVIAMSGTDTLTIYGGTDDSLSAGAEAGTWNLDSTDGAYNYYSLNGATLIVQVDVQNDLVAT